MTKAIEADIGIQFFGECWGNIRGSVPFDAYIIDNQCLSSGFKRVDEEYFQKPCLPYSGSDRAAFMYKVRPKGNNTANIYLFKVDNRNTRKRCEISSKLTIKTTERCQKRRSGVFVVNFGCTSHIFLVFLLSSLNK